MKYILSRSNRKLLAAVARARVLLAFDYDGTLAPIVSDRAKAKMRQRTRRLFARVCALYPCAVISGRSRADVRARIDAAPVKYVVGNHGIEPGRHLARFARASREAARELAEALAGWRGVEIENKRYSLAIHYRRAQRKEQARKAIHAAIERSSRPMRVVPGKLVVNVVPRGSPHKGEALGSLRSRERAEIALYIGDDVTDEDVFAHGPPERLLGIRVGRAAGSSAGYFIRGQREIDALLSALLALRAEGTLPSRP